MGIWTKIKFWLLELLVAQVKVEEKPFKDSDLALLSEITLHTQKRDFEKLEAALDSLYTFNFTKNSQAQIKQVIDCLEYVASGPINSSIKDLVITIYESLADFSEHRIAYDSLKKLSSGALKDAATNDILESVETDHSSWKH